MDCDVLVIGCGPAGMTAAQYSARYGRKTIIIDPMPGGQLDLIHKIENYPGFESISGYELMEKMFNQAESFGVTIKYLTAKSLRKIEDYHFEVDTEEGTTIAAKSVIVATGASPRRLGVPGEEEYLGKGVSYCATCDGPFFKNKRVVVVGGGDTALTDALYLSEICDEVVLVHRRHEFRAQKVLQDRVHDRANILKILGRTVKSINGNGEKVTGVTLDDGTGVICDGVFVFVGTQPSTEFLNEGLYNVVNLINGYIFTNFTDAVSRTSMTGVFACGDVRNNTFRQVATAVGDGARAAYDAEGYLSQL